jgi:hypothetical protein
MKNSKKKSPEDIQGSFFVFKQDQMRKLKILSETLFLPHHPKIFPVKNP